MMKKLTMLFLLCSMVTMLSFDAMGMYPINKPPKNDNPGVVGAPLDGGLLAVLGAAGVAYFASKKKRNNSEQ